MKLDLNKQDDEFKKEMEEEIFNLKNENEATKQMLFNVSNENVLLQQELLRLQNEYANIKQNEYANVPPPVLVQSNSNNNNNNKSNMEEEAKQLISILSKVNFSLFRTKQQQQKSNGRLFSFSNFLSILVFAFSANPYPVMETITDALVT